MFWTCCKTKTLSVIGHQKPGLSPEKGEIWSLTYKQFLKSAWNRNCDLFFPNVTYIRLNRLLVVGRSRLPGALKQLKQMCHIGPSFWSRFGNPIFSYSGSGNPSYFYSGFSKQLWTGSPWSRYTVFKITSALNGTTYHNVVYQLCKEQVEEPPWGHCKCFLFWDKTHK